MFPTPAPKRPRVTVKASAVPLKQLEITLGVQQNDIWNKNRGFLIVTRTKRIAYLIKQNKYLYLLYASYESLKRGFEGFNPGFGKY